MPGGFSNFLEDKSLGHIFIEDYVAPDNLYIGLCTANPTETGTGASCFELPNEDNYARVETVPGDWELAATPGIVRNKNMIEFNVPDANWGLIKYFVILDSGTYDQGNMLIYGLVDPEVEIVEGSIPRFSVGAMSILLE